MNLFNDEPSISNREQHVMNIVFSLNRECNLRCHHCCLSNEYKASKDNMSLEYLDRYFNMIDNWLTHYKHDMDMITLLMSGAEITMLSDAKFIEYGEKIYKFYQYVAKKYPDISFEMLLLSNLIVISDKKKEWIKLIYDRAKNENLTVSMSTSYEKYTNRFYKPEIQKKWERNIKWFNNNNIPVLVIWAVTKQDALDSESIIEYLNSLQIELFYVAMLPTGESAKNHGVVPSYEDFEFFLRKLYKHPNVSKLMNSQKRPYDFDKVVNLILEQNGFVMMDLLQDLVLHYESNNNNNFNYSNNYITEENKPIFALTEPENDLLSMEKFWKKYLLQERMYRIKSGCYNCQFFEYCLGGIHTFRPIYHSKDKCPGFKNFLTDMSNLNKKNKIINIEKI